MFIGLSLFALHVNSLLLIPNNIVSTKNKFCLTALNLKNEDNKEEQKKKYKEFENDKQKLKKENNNKTSKVEEDKQTKAFSSFIIKNTFVCFPILILSYIFSYFQFIDLSEEIKIFFIATFQCMVTSFTYAKDRRNDYSRNINVSKDQEKEETITQNIDNVIETLSIAICTSSFFGFFLFDKMKYLFTFGFILPVLYTTEFYTQIKQKYSLIKPFYVAFCWSFIVYFLPYSLLSPFYTVNWSLWISCFLFSFAMTNSADIPDLEEDKLHHIKTIPVVYGKKTSYFITRLCLLLTLIIYPHDNYENINEVLLYIISIVYFVNSTQVFTKKK